VPEGQVCTAGGGGGMQPTVAGVERTSMIWSFHWSPIVNLQFPPGLGNVKKNDVPALQQKLRRLFIGKKDRLFLFNKRELPQKNTHRISGDFFESGSRKTGHHSDARRLITHDRWPLAGDAPLHATGAGSGHSVAQTQARVATATAATDQISSP